MEFIKFFVQNSYVSLFLAISLLFILLYSNKLGERNTIFFKIGIVCLILVNILTCVDSYLGEKLTVFSYWRVIILVIIYWIMPLIVLFLIFQIVGFKLSKKQKLWLMIPELVNIGIVSTAFFTGKVVFAITESNEFINGTFLGGIFSYITFVVSLAYLVVALVFSLHVFKGNNNEEKSFIIYLAIIVSITMLFETLKIVTRVLIPVITGCYLFYYLYSYIQIAKTDALTGLYNRHTFYDDLDNRNGLSAIISIDMNNLKELNDYYGHEAGDLGLYTISSIFLKNSDSKIKSYRVGGDEFIILCFKMSKDEVITLINNIKEQLAETNYTCAFGYAYYDGSKKDCNAMLRTADAMMYEEKHRMKKK